MSCLINSALALDCMNAMGGLKTAYILAGEITSTTVVAGEITAIAGTGSFYEFQLAKDTAFFSEAINVSNTAGTVYYEGVLTMILQKMDAEKNHTHAKIWSFQVEQPTHPHQMRHVKQHQEAMCQQQFA